MRRFFPFLIIIVVLLAALGGFFYFKNRATNSTSGRGVSNVATPAPATTNDTGKTAPSTPPVRVVNEPGASPPHALGPADAPVTLEEFGDFQCPPCGFLHPELKKIANTYGSKVRIIFRELPLVPSHPHALTAARAAEAAGMQGKFWEMHGIIFENQRTWHSAFDARPIFEEYAKAIGLNVERYKRDLGSSTVEQRIFLDGKRAHALNVTGTPTVFLNGKEVPFDSLPADRLGSLIDAELARIGR
jgi:protein-disulfide isomerase